MKQWAQGKTGLNLCFSVWWESKQTEPASSWMGVSLAAKCDEWELAEAEVTAGET